MCNKYTLASCTLFQLSIALDQLVYICETTLQKQNSVFICPIDHAFHESVIPHVC